MEQGYNSDGLAMSNKRTRYVGILNYMATTEGRRYLHFLEKPCIYIMVEPPQSTGSAEATRVCIFEQDSYRLKLLASYIS